MVIMAFLPTGGNAAAKSFVDPTKKYTYTQLGKDIKELQQQYPDLVKVKTIGKSEYGRNIYAVSLGKGSAKVFINGSHHAREWMTTSLNMELIDQYAEAYKGNKKIGGYIADMVHDYDCIQLGVGGMPDVVGNLLAESDLKDLGMHTELCSDAYYALHESGKLTNRRKSRLPGKGLTGIVLGSQNLYDWVDRNPSVMMAPLEYINAPATIAQQDNMISINSCIAVDIYGQICAESAGLRHISGTGGQLDYVTGTAMARGGKSFLCMTSCFEDKDGVKESRILPHFEGDIVTAPRSQAHFIVTEYGAVNLAGRTTWERAEMLISIAHPDFREELIRAAEDQKIWRKSNKR